MDGAGPAWYVVHTKPRSEAKTERFLGQRGVHAFLPRLLVHRRHGFRRWAALEPLFPGYLFARFAPGDGSLERVRWTPGVRRLLGSDDRPTPVSDDIIGYLRERAGNQGFIVQGSPLVPGSRVMFREGAFAHLEGIIECAVSKGRRVRVLLSILHRRTSVTVGVDEVEPV